MHIIYVYDRAESRDDYLDGMMLFGERHILLTIQHT